MENNYLISGRVDNYIVSSVTAIVVVCSCFVIIFIVYVALSTGENLHVLLYILLKNVYPLVNVANNNHERYAG